MTLLIHPGFHKTGTTWLQRRVFGSSDVFHSLLGHDEIFDLFARPHDFDFELANVRDRLAVLRAAAPQSKIHVLSSETLSGTRMTGQRESKMIADRLAAVCGNAKILITTRSQGATLMASYKQYVKRGGRKSPEDYLYFRPEPGFYFFDIKQLAYHKLVEHYADMFGASNVMVLPHEALIDNSRRYFSQLLLFAAGREPDEGEYPAFGEREGFSPPASGLALLRLSSHFRRTPFDSEPFLPFKPIGRGIASLGYRWKIGDRAATERLSKLFSSVIDGRFEESNRRLQQYSSFNLSDLGYPT